MIDLSVIIPAYNAAPYIRQALDSVLDQLRPNIEIITVDDGSTDATPEILAGYGDRIRTIRQHNQGLSAARNRGIAMASGAWLAFLDADDLWLPNFAASMLAVTSRSNKETTVICCGWQYVDQDGKAEGKSIFPPSDQIDVAKLLWGNAFPVHAAIVQRDSVSNIGGFSTDCYGVQDWKLWLDLSLIGARFTSLREVLVQYRQVPGSMSRNVTRMRDNGFQVLNKVFDSSLLPPHLASLREHAHGLVRIWAGVNFFGIGLRQEGLAEFTEALTSQPALLGDSRTYYAILCAEQPLAWRGTGHGLDLQTAEERLNQILALVFKQEPALAAIYRSRSQQLSHQAIARLANMQGNPRLTFKHALRSLVHRPSGSGFQDLFRFAARTLIARNQE